MSSDDLRDLIRLSQELKLYDLPPEVCVTHKRFVPCRKNDEECFFSSDPGDIGRVRAYQSS